MRCEIAQHRSLIAIYDRKENRFRYHQDMLDYFGSGLADQFLWDYWEKTGILAPDMSRKMAEVCRQLDDTQSLCSRNIRLDAFGMHTVTCAYADGKVIITLRNLEEDYRSEGSVRTDELTGLLSRNAFCREIERIVSGSPDRGFAVVFFDVVKFKAINDLFGYSEGDHLLMFISGKLKAHPSCILAPCRESADRFCFLADITDKTADSIVNGVLSEIERYGLSFAINCNAGIYPVAERGEAGHAMLDKAVLAQASIKGSYTHKIHYYTNELRDQMLSEQEIIGGMNAALEEGQFVLYYQPQYDHSTGMVVGAEALIRWQHPERGLIAPGVFIPIFEKNGFITRLDMYVFRQVCMFLRHSLDNNLAVVPISINFSKNDIYAQNFVEELEHIRGEYNVPARYLRIEVTESVVITDTRSINDIFKKLHDCGYVIEMDDFGSGYSSLNVLKDLEFDIIKLDMLFLEGQKRNDRGGTILTSVVNMAKWLKLSVIAEGVETVSQADFLRSIGCDYIQGYLYSRPLPRADYEKLISGSRVGAMVPQMDLIDSMNFADFWDPQSQETLIFNNYVGGAAVFRYNRRKKTVEILRVNKKYVQELGMNLSEREIMNTGLDIFASAMDKKIYFDTLERAISTMEEQECETWRTIVSDCCGQETIYVRSTMKVIGSGGDQFLFYSMIRNMTAEKQSYESMLDTEKRFKMASEQVNIYFWEYTVATREMRPCFRCMRDLGLPPLLRNYPDSAIERGIFPPEVADMYRDWHVQVANGVKELEAIIPLTPDRVPFRVRYTTEFDENGYPVKAYGSAALVVD